MEIKTFYAILNDDTMMIIQATTAQEAVRFALAVGLKIKKFAS